MEKYYIFTFETTHFSISADMLLDKNSVPHKLIPVPQEISPGCGFCVRVAEERFGEAKRLLIESGVELSGSYSVERDGLKSTVREVKL